MLRIRLRRTGAKKKPSYRLVVADARAPRDGAFVDILGYYNPLTDPSTVVIDAAKAQKWLSQGAQPSDRVARLFKREGIGAGADGAQTAEVPAAAEASARRTRRPTAPPAEAAGPATTEAPAAEAPVAGEPPAAAAQPAAPAVASAEAPAAGEAPAATEAPAEAAKPPRGRAAKAEAAPAEEPAAEEPPTDEAAEPKTPRTRAAKTEAPKEAPEASA